MPTEDDGTRDDPLLSDRSLAITAYRPDVAALAARPTRVVIAVGEESLAVLTGRTAGRHGDLLGQEATVFPSHHGGFMGGEFGYAGQPEAFAARLREVLATDLTSCGTCACVSLVSVESDRRVGALGGEVAGVALLEVGGQLLGRGVELDVARQQLGRARRDVRRPRRGSHTCPRGTTWRSARRRRRPRRRSPPSAGAARR
jgi:hypothetical protein